MNLHGAVCRPGAGAAAEGSASDSSDAAAPAEPSEADSDGGSSGEAAAAAAAAACVEVATPHPLAGTVFFDEFKETGAPMPPPPPPELVIPESCAWAVDGGVAVLHMHGTCLDAHTRVHIRSAAAPVPILAEKHPHINRSATVGLGCGCNGERVHLVGALPCAEGPGGLAVRRGQPGAAQHVLHALSGS